MPYALKKPHPTVPNVKVWHTWDPDGDGYEEVRKFVTQEQAQEFADNFADVEIVEVAYEIGQDDDYISMRLEQAANPVTPNGVAISTNRDDPTAVGAISTFTPGGKLG